MREVISVHGKLPSTPPSLPIHALRPAHRIVCFFCVARAVLEHLLMTFLYSRPGWLPDRQFLLGG